MKILCYVTSLSLGSVFLKTDGFVSVWIKVVVAALWRGQYIDECQHCDFKHEILWFNEIKLLKLSLLYCIGIGQLMYCTVLASMRLCPCGWLHYSSTTDLELGWIHAFFMKTACLLSFSLFHLTGYDHKNLEPWSLIYCTFSYRDAICFIWWL